MFKRLFAVIIAFSFAGTSIASADTLDGLDGYSKLPKECVESAYCAFITNLETGEVKVLEKNHESIGGKFLSNPSQVEAEVGYDDLASIGMLPKDYSYGAVPLASGSSSVNVTPVKLTAGMDYTISGEKIKVTRVFGSLKITNNQLSGTVSDSLLVARDHASGHVLKKYPDNRPNSSFSYNTGWDWVQYASGTYGAYVLYDAYFQISGMSAKTKITVKFSPEN